MYKLLQFARAVQGLLYKIITAIMLKFYGISIKGKKITINGFPLIISQGKLILGKSIKLNSGKYRNVIGGSTRLTIMISKNANMEIGDNVRISNSSIVCTIKISIGNNTMIGGDCKIWDTDFHPLNPEERLINPNKHTGKEIVIGKNVFIGGSSIILKGVNIGDNSVIGAGSVVRGKIPCNQIWAGNPAVFIKEVQ